MFRRFFGNSIGLIMEIELSISHIASFSSRHLTRDTSNDGYPSVPARPISEGAAPCPYCIAPCPIYPAPCTNKNKQKLLQTKFFLFFFILQNVIAVFVFSDSRCKNACKMLADLCACFHQLPAKLYRPRFVRVLDRD